MTLHRFPDDMANEIRELAKQYPINLEKAEWFYLKGGYCHAKKLIEAMIKGNLDDGAIELINDGIWIEKNKKRREYK